VEEKPMEGWVVGYLPGSLRDNARIWWSEMIEKRVKEAGAEKFIMIDSQHEVTKQVSDGEDILQMGIDILVMNPNDADAMVPIVEKANEMGIPVVCIDRTTNGGEIISTVGLDNWQLGEGSAKFIVEKLIERYGEPRGKVLHLQGALGASVVFERGESFRQVLRNYPDIEIVGEPSSKYWSTDDGLAFTEDALTVHPDLDALYTHTDFITLGAFNAVEAAGKLDQVIIVGQNFYGGIPDIIKEGKYMVYDWALDARAIGAAAGDVCIKVAKGRINEIPLKIGLPNVFITHENVDEYWHLNLDYQGE
jgi:ribose transport system substrate-binding protein